MKFRISKYGGNRFISLYEALVWGLYVGMFKYGNLLEISWVPHVRANFPFPELILYAAATTLYIVPYYRLLGPWFLRRGWIAALVAVTVIYMLLVPKYCNWLVSWIAAQLNTNNALNAFYSGQLHWYTLALNTRMIRVQEILTDLLAFLSVMFMRYAFENERKRHALEKDHLQLQLETLKAQLHPHFLFNTLNSIYGMSLTGAKETPAFILRLSDMMRYVLYDCRTHEVMLDKDIAFLNNYMEMEKTRYPQAQMDFTILAAEAESKAIAPLMIIPFMENCFKHGAHRVTDNGFIKGILELKGNVLQLTLSNNVLPVISGRQKLPGGVGIENVKKRLALYYPNRHTLQIDSRENLYTVHLEIHL